MRPSTDVPDTYYITIFIISKPMLRSSYKEIIGTRAPTFLLSCHIHVMVSMNLLHSRLSPYFVKETPQQLRRSQTE